jgi:hypothetical protein
VPELEQAILSLMEEGPLPVSDPFIFGNSPDAAVRSRNAYMAILRGMGIKPIRGMHWPRTGIIEAGFRIEISDKLRGSLIRLSNVQPDAQWVFGKRAVLGHIATGWDEQLSAAIVLIREKAHTRIQQLWHESVQEARRER